MKTYSLSIYLRKNSKLPVSICYYPTLELAQTIAADHKYYRIMEYIELGGGLISHSYGMYGFKSF